MSKMIEVEPLVKQLITHGHIPDTSGYVTITAQNCGSIYGVPVVEAESVRHGKWANTLTYGMIKEWNCTNCGASAPYKECSSDQYLSDYCPDCGAKMDGGADQ